MKNHLVAVVLIVCLFSVRPAVAVDATSDSSKSADAVRANESTSGYRGIWFTLGQYFGEGRSGKAYSARSSTPLFPYGDKYSGGLGTYTAKHSPLAIYSAEAKKTFFVYGGTTGAANRHLLCMVSYYDHRTGQVPRPVVVHDKNGVDDPHDNPSLAIDGEGYVWVFVSGRGQRRPGFKYRSDLPYDIGSFTLVSEEEFTYPQPHTIEGEGFLHLFTKYTGTRELYFETSTEGQHWGDDIQLAGIREAGHERGGHYQASARAGEKIGTFFNRHPQGNTDRRTDLYYAQTTDMGETWTTVEGQPLSLPLTKVDNPARVIDYASRGLNVYVKDMDFDSGGHPVFLYVTSPSHEPGPPNDPRHFCVTRWDGNQWQTSQVGTTDHNYDMGSLYLQEDRWTLRIPSVTGPQSYQGGGEIALWESRDQGRSWRQTKLITRQSKLNHNYVRRPVNARDPFFAFWADGNPNQLSESHLYFTNEDGDRVWKLPYDMKTDFAEPIEQ